MTDKITAGPPPTADVQDPLPESDFFWRRWFTWFFTIASLGILGFVIHLLGGRSNSTPALHEIALWLVVLAGVLATYYMIAPSAEQIVKMIKTASMFSKGVAATTTARAATPDGRVAETQTTINGPEATSTTGPAPTTAGGGRRETEILE